MNIDFQLMDACLEDRIPDAMSENTTVNDLLCNDFHNDASNRAKGAHHDLEKPVAFLFGRMHDGKSVCVRVEGARPKLFFLASEVDSPHELQNVLTAEIDDPNHVDLRITMVDMCHFNGYEPDDAAPSGRRVHQYYQVEFPSMLAYRKIVALRRKEDEDVLEAIQNKRPAPPRRHLTAHEHCVDPLTRFLRDSNLTPGGWNRATRATQADVVFSTCNLEVSARMENLASLPDIVHNAPLRVLYYDAETIGLSPEKGTLIQVSLVLACGSSLQKHIVALDSVARTDAFVVHAVSSERDLLRKVRRLIIEWDVDIRVAYNGVNFDERFLAVRAEKEGVVEFMYQSKLAFYKSRLRELQLSSQGMGDNKFSILETPGRPLVDFFVKFKIDEVSEVSWSLSHFTRKYIPGEDKEDMDYREIPKLQKGSPEDRLRLASYCVHDSYLLYLLDKKRNILVTVVQFAQVFGVLPNWVYMRGQQVRFVSQVYHAARSMEQMPLLLQTPPGGFVGCDDDSGYEGGVVNEPLTGYYDKEPIATLDWKSLYPSIMLAHNTCHSTHVLDGAFYHFPGVVAHHVRTLGLQWQEVDQVAPDAVECDYNPLQMVLLRRLRELYLADKQPVRKGSGSTDEKPPLRSLKLTKAEWESLRTHCPALTNHTVVRVGRSVLQPVGAHTTYFATKHRGILPRILETLLAERDVAKRRKKEHEKLCKQLSGTDDAASREHRALADVFDGRQLAVKISANSVYGACGAGRRGKLPNKDVSETVTFEGRETMNIVKEILPPAYPGIVVVYGDTDSVMVKFDGVTTVDECATLAHSAADFVTNEFLRRGYPSMILEFEKIFSPYLLLKKKRYIGLKFEPNGDRMEEKGIDAKGVETERKDTLPLLKTIYCDVREQLMYHRDGPAALEAMSKHLWQLVEDKVPFESFVLSKGLRSEYHDPSTQVQCCVNAKRAKREAGSEVAVGDRVQYVVVNGWRKSKKTDLAEDPVFARENGLKINRLWYFENAIRKPMQTVFDKVCGRNAERLFTTIKAELQRERLGGGSLRALVPGKRSLGEDDVDEADAAGTGTSEVRQV